RHLFTGQQWYNQVALYDLRNRYYSPDSGRFLQADPSGFNGDATNLYRHCGNNPVTMSDPTGLAWAQRQLSGNTANRDGNDVSPYGLWGLSGMGFSPAGPGLVGFDTSFMPGGGGYLDSQMIQNSMSNGTFEGVTPNGNLMTRAEPVRDSNGNIVVNLQ